MLFWWQMLPYLLKNKLCDKVAVNTIN